jgi:hypothetical protein
MDDINKLKDILSRSKAVMKKTDAAYGAIGNTSSINDTSTQTYEEKEIPNLTENYINSQQDRSTRSVSPQNGHYKNLKTTKMPKNIVDAMVNNPIEIPESPYPSFELDQVEDLVNESTVHQPNLEDLRPSPKKNVDTNNIRQIVREEIESVVRDVVEGYLDKALITEDIQIKIGNTVFSGNLKPLPKKRKRRV